MSSWRAFEETRGFTFVELLFTILVLSIGVFSLLMNLTYTLRLVKENRIIMLAQNNASSEMQKLFNTPFSDPQLSSGLHDLTAQLHPEILQDSPDATATLNVCLYNPTSGKCDAGGSSDVKQATVTVRLYASRVFRMTSLLTAWTGDLAAANVALYPPP